ncbi:SDR family NAD(P)-dependent oxidoreductase [uncultured Kordia sp.]|uniref:SDR family NAD(P)-dependent oxidoreductase n=1 Tax=uncultured Kordia sp. TaxID=507699 RepID=UPI002635E782|nr:SDR family NAD(P)-dependent oxidoreductase [uncultured Kordia sp.]
MKKTIIITGSTDGIGKLTAIKLAKEGHEVYIHGRNSEKLAKVISEIQAASNNSNIKGFAADLSTMAAVQQLAEKMKATVPKIDVLINNAGVYNSRIAKSTDGLDLRFAVNYIAPYILTNELLPLLETSENARIVNLSSAAQAPVSLDALAGNVTVTEQVSYAQSKLALTMWSFYLAKQHSNIQVIAVNPGSLLNTNMVKEAFGTHWSSADKGADILYDLTVSEEHKGITGKYFDNDKGSYGNAHPDAYDKEKIQKLINKTENIIGVL